MDKVTLTKEQLTILKRFIESRGFREPLIVMEVLDHFACLVEEKLHANPSMPLEDAMREAHASFGVMGFKTLADAADRERNKMYNKVFKKHLKKFFTSPLQLVFVLLWGVFIYKLYHLVQPLNWGWPFEGAKILSMAMMVIYFAGSMAVLWKMPDVNKRYRSAYGGLWDNGYSWVLFLVMMNFPSYTGEKWLWLFATIAGVFAIAIVAILIVQFQAMTEFTNRDKYIRDSYLASE